MSIIEAILLGILQGLTEFLPVSSSGHLEIGKAVMGIDPSDSLVFTIVVHGATVLSTLVVFHKDIITLFSGLFRFQWNDETKYIVKIILSMVPVAFIGVFMREETEARFDGNIRFVGYMLMFTAILLAIAYFKGGGGRKINFRDAFVIGIAQAVAVLPGISRSGATIATGLIIGNRKETIARFSFLMVLVPIIGANVKDMFSGEMTTSSTIPVEALVAGFMAAFFAGLFACKWMISIVKKGKLIYFAIYCLLISVVAMITG